MIRYLFFSLLFIWSFSTFNIVAQGDNKHLVGSYYKWIELNNKQLDSIKLQLNLIDFIRDSVYWMSFPAFIDRNKDTIFIPQNQFVYSKGSIHYENGYYRSQMCYFNFDLFGNDHKLDKIENAVFEIINDNIIYNGLRYSKEFNHKWFQKITGY